MRNRMNRWMIAATLLMAPAIFASSANVSFQASATVTPDCRITVTDLSFGQYDPLGQNSSRELNAAAGVSMLCTRDARATIVIDAGQNPVGTTRGLASGGQVVSYQLYRDADRTQVWGSGADALQFVSAGVQNPQQFVVYARIPPGQGVASGRYSDGGTATVDVREGLLCNDGRP